MMVPKFFKNPSSFLDNWKYVTSNDSIFQVILLLSNLAFSHDLTCILGIQNKSQPNLLEHLKSFCARLSWREFETILRRGDEREEEHASILKKSVLFAVPIICSTPAVSLRYPEEVYRLVSSIEEFEYLALPKFSFEFSTKIMGTGDLFDNTLKNYKKMLEDPTQHTSSLHPNGGAVRNR